VIQLSAIGDVALFGDYSKIIQKKGYRYPFSMVSDYLKDNDIVLANLETPLSNKGMPDKSKPISLCGSPSAIDSLTHTGITHVSLANNHSYDYGEKAIIDTQKRLKEAGISFIGIGDNLEYSRQPLIENISGVTLAILAYNSYTTNGRHYASKLRGGVAPLEYKYIKSDIESIKQNHANSIIIVSLHWGVEGSNYPTPFQRDLARQIIKDGADIIIGHHPHVIQGIEQYGKGIIVYSLGNFCFPDVVSPHIDGIGFTQKSENKESFIFQCNITNEGIEGSKIVPVLLNDYLQPEIALNEIESSIQKKIQSLSKSLNNSNYKKYYLEQVVNKEKQKFSLFNLFKREGFYGIIKRLRIMYIRAYLHAFKNFLRETMHKKYFYNLFEE